MFEIGDKVYFDGCGDGFVSDKYTGNIIVRFNSGLVAFAENDNRLIKINKSILLSLPDKKDIFVGNIDFDKTVEDLEKDLRTRVLVNEFSQKRLDLLKALRVYLGKGEIKIRIEE